MLESKKTFRLCFGICLGSPRSGKKFWFMNTSVSDLFVALMLYKWLSGHTMNRFYLCGIVVLTETQKMPRWPWWRGCYLLYNLSSIRKTLQASHSTDSPEVLLLIVGVSTRNSDPRLLHNDRRCQAAVKMITDAFHNLLYLNFSIMIGFPHQSIINQFCCSHFVTSICSVPGTQVSAQCLISPQESHVWKVIFLTAYINVTPSMHKYIHSLAQHVLTLGHKIQWQTLGLFLFQICLTNSPCWNGFYSSVQFCLGEASFSSQYRGNRDAGCTHSIFLIWCSLVLYITDKKERNMMMDRKELNGFHLVALPPM